MKKNILLLSFTFLFVAGKLYAQDLLLKNYRPVSIYKTAHANITKAAFPIIDMHSHDYALTQQEIDTWVKNMDSIGIEKTMILSFKTGKGFDSVIQKYSRYPTRFEIWCGFDFTDYGKDGWQQKAVKELERCHKLGAKGVGEFSDKGNGERNSQYLTAIGLHIDDALLKPLLSKCAALKMPINIHVAEDQWMYEKPDSTNDGLLNAAEWHVDMDRPEKLNHDELINSLENAVKENPKTIFIACHFANCNSDLTQLGKMLDKYPNLYADIAARYAEIAPVPKYAASFITKYQDRVLYGTDMGFEESMYKTTLRILESNDEHFYATELFSYHWSLYGLGLSKNVLKKIYKTNAAKILK
jgi:uncharacterized protein